MTSRRIIITGASDGIGAAAARQLTAAGNQVVLVGRSPDKTAALAGELSVPYHLVDFARLSDVRRLADELDAAYPRIDVLANNAGAIMADRAVTDDGYERTFAVNHLAGFLLTTRLMPKLLASRATVIQTSSVAARTFARFDINDLNAEHSYSAQLAYGNSKLANIAFTKELDRRYGAQGLAAVAFHPGVVGTNFAHDGSRFMRFVYGSRWLRGWMLSPDEGASQLVWLAQSTPGEDWQPGGYYERRILHSGPPEASDEALAERLWAYSEQAVVG